MVKTGIVGLGRLGKSHAINLLNIPNCELKSACSIVTKELEWAKEHGISEVYSDYDEMLELSDIDAVFLVSSTSLHAGQIIKGLEAEKHVFCEKPLAVNVKECRKAVDIINKLANKKIFMLGFVRRFDPAYAFAKKRITQGAIGKPFMVRSQTSDHDDFAPFQIEYTKTSGGIFHDMNVHDIDLARWYLGSELRSVYALGGSYVHKEFGAIGDADNASVMCEFDDGGLAVITASRTALHGHDTRTEIYGTKGIIRIGFTPAVADVTILDNGGIRSECVYTFFDRFREAFALEAQAFIRCIDSGEKSEISVLDGVRATEAAEAFTESFKKKAVVQLTDTY